MSFRGKQNETRRSNVSMLKNSRARHRKAYLARIKTPLLDGGDPIPVVGAVYTFDTTDFFVGLTLKALHPSL